MVTLVNMWLGLWNVHRLKKNINCVCFQRNLQRNLCNQTEDDTALSSSMDEFIPPSKSKPEEHSCLQSGETSCLMPFVPAQHLLIKISAQIERRPVCSEAGIVGPLCMQGADTLSHICAHLFLYNLLSMHMNTHTYCTHTGKSQVLTKCIAECNYITAWL